MKRRCFVRIALAVAAPFVLSGHTPYRHWKVYRQKHLLVGSCRADPRSFAVAGQIAGTLARHLPASSARVSRAPDQRRVASLLASDQWQVAVLRRQEAVDLVIGRGLFETVGAVMLRSLFAVDAHLLVCRPDFPDRHAWLVTATLTENAEEVAGGAPVGPGAHTVPLHTGARAYADGDPPPPGPATGDGASETANDHPH
jgi:hypothetical protein